MRSGMARKPVKEVEFEQDAWRRFERAVGVVAKSPPQPKVKKKRVSRKKKT